MAEPPTSAGVVTAEELLYLNLPDKQTELVRGSLIVREPPGYQHGLVALLAEHDALEGEDVLPGFGCSLTDLW